MQLICTLFFAQKLHKNKMDILQLLHRIPKRCQVNVAHFDGRFKWRVDCRAFVRQINVNSNKYQHIKHCMLLTRCSKYIEYTNDETTTYAFTNYEYESNTKDVKILQYFVYKQNKYFISGYRIYNRITSPNDCAYLQEYVYNLSTEYKFGWSCIIGLKFTKFMHTIYSRNGVGEFVHNIGYTDVMLYNIINGHCYYCQNRD